MNQRPKIAILARFANNTSATRYGAIITARRLAELVYAAGGDPITFLPAESTNWAERLQNIHGILMPGGADINPKQYNQTVTSEHVYDTDDLADNTDIELLNYTLNNTTLPYLGICRGLQITNVARGGTLIQHMEHPHQHHVAPIIITTEAKNLGLTNPTTLQASCYHHQIIDSLGEGLNIIARSAEGYPEAIKIETPNHNWAYAVQWHPEDNYDTDANQLKLVETFITEARKQI